MRIPYDELCDVLRTVLIRNGFDADRAGLCARLFAEASRDGVYSHGLNRFPRFLQMVRSGVVDVAARPERLSAQGTIERWDGHRGAGNLNAHASMARAIELAREHGAGCVALSNTNHWMRGGSYGWQAAEAGAIAICWTNTLANVPPWGLSEPRIGNNPLVLAVPRPDGHVVLDMAMSQFSFGALEAYGMRGELLPVAGGYDDSGQLSRDPAAIQRSGRLLPIGYWKGSGLALMLDMIGAILSGGRATHEVPSTPTTESELSQVFIAFEVPLADAARVASGIIDNLHAPSTGRAHARYPGERTLETRQRNLAEGVPVEPAVWAEVQRAHHG